MKIGCSLFALALAGSLSVACGSAGEGGAPTEGQEEETAMASSDNLSSSATKGNLRFHIGDPTQSGTRSVTVAMSPALAREVKVSLSPECTVTSQGGASLKGTCPRGGQLVFENRLTGQRAGGPLDSTDDVARWRIIIRAIVLGCLAIDFAGDITGWYNFDCPLGVREQAAPVGL